MIVSLVGNESIGKGRQYVICNEFIERFYLLREYKQQLLDWLKFMLIILFFDLKNKALFI